MARFLWSWKRDHPLDEQIELRRGHCAAHSPPLAMQCMHCAVVVGPLKSSTWWENSTCLLFPNWTMQLMSELHTEAWVSFGNRRKITCKLTNPPSALAIIMLQPAIEPEHKPQEPALVARPGPNFAMLTHPRGKPYGIDLARRDRCGSVIMADNSVWECVCPNSGCIRCALYHAHDIYYMCVSPLIVVLIVWRILFRVGQVGGTTAFARWTAILTQSNFFASGPLPRAINSSLKAGLNHIEKSTGSAIP